MLLLNFCELIEKKFLNQNVASCYSFFFNYFLSILVNKRVEPEIEEKAKFFENWKEEVIGLIEHINHVFEFFL